MGRNSTEATGCRTRYVAVLALIFVTAFAVRLLTTQAFVGLFAPVDVEANPDQLDYEETAYQMSIGNGYSKASGEPTARRPPGTSLTILLPYLVLGRSPGAARLLFCLISAATCLVVAWVARQIFGQLAALLAAAWLAFYPGHVYYSLHLLSEPPFGLFLALGCGCVLAALRRRSRIWDILAGGAFALAILTRPQILLMVPIAWILVLAFTRERRRIWIRHLALQSLVLVLGLTPWLARNAMVFGKPTLSTVGGTTFWGCNNERAAPYGWWVPASSLVDDTHPWPEGEVELEAVSWRYGFDYLEQNWKRIPTFLSLRLWRLVSPFEATENRAVFWAFAVAWILTAPFVVAGFIHIQRRAPSQAMVLLLPVLGIVATTLLFYGAIRFRDSLAPILVVPAAIAASRLLERYSPALTRLLISPDADV